MVYKDMVLGTLTQTAIDERDNVYFKMAQEVEEVYRKAKAFDKVLKIDNQATDEDKITGQHESDIETVISNYREDK
ncbi:hypothetical protein [Staphylococcus shinii]|uniref:hypothetical protein n=1 Tax=Staphylococcus shinii TaxID=2912228 RepID=UPI00351661E6